MVLAVGLGPADEVGPHALRRAAAAIGRSARGRSSVAVDLLRLATDDGAGPAGAEALAEGLLSGSYRYDDCRSTIAAPIRTESVVLVAKGGTGFMKFTAHFHAVRFG